MDIYHNGRAEVTVFGIRKVDVKVFSPNGDLIDSMKVKSIKEAGKCLSDLLCKDIVEAAIADDNVKRCAGEDFFPPPLVCPNGFINSYTGLRAAKLGPIKDDAHKTLLERIHTHLCHIICNSDETAYEYLLDWLAHRVQMPGDLPRVALLIRGKPGGGKDIIFRWFGNRILGDVYITIVQRYKQLKRDVHSLHLKDKLLVVVSEHTRKDAQDEETLSSIKGDITKVKTEIRPILQQAHSRNHCAGYVFLINTTKPIYIESGDRRFVLIETSGELCNDVGYISELQEALHDDRVARAFYDELLARDIGEWENRVDDRPMTAFLKETKQATCDPLYRFLASEFASGGEDVVRIKCKEFHDAYFEFMGEKKKGALYGKNCNSLIYRIDRFIADGGGSMTRVKGSKTQFYEVTKSLLWVELEKMAGLSRSDYVEEERAPPTPKVQDEESDEEEDAEDYRRPKVSGKKLRVDSDDDEGGESGDDEEDDSDDEEEEEEPRGEPSSKRQRTEE